MKRDALMLFLRDYGKLIAVLLIAAVTAVVSCHAPSREDRRLAELEACKKKCAPLAGVMEGKQRFPTEPATDRRNYPTHAQCVCR